MGEHQAYHRPPVFVFETVVVGTEVVAVEQVVLPILFIPNQVNSMNVDLHSLRQEVDKNLKLVLRQLKLLKRILCVLVELKVKLILLPYCKHAIFFQEVRHCLLRERLFCHNVILVADAVEFDQRLVVSLDVLLNDHGVSKKIRVLFFSSTKDF